MEILSQSPALRRQRQGLAIATKPAWYTFGCGFRYGRYGPMEAMPREIRPTVVKEALEQASRIQEDYDLHVQCFSMI